MNVKQNINNTFQGSVVFIFSQFSKACSEVYSLAQKIPNVRFLCIDHPHIRSQISSSIQYVPCILLMGKNGTITYEGKDAIEWIQLNVPSFEEESKSEMKVEVNTPKEEEPKVSYSLETTEEVNLNKQSEFQKILQQLQNTNEEVKAALPPSSESSSIPLNTPSNVTPI